MAFSATLTLSDLNDYLAPSQACIRPVDELEPVEQLGDGAKTAIEIDRSTGAYFETTAAVSGVGGVGIHDLPSSSSTTGQRKKLKKAEISLNDCLACSGCITTSQELLLQTHSLKPLLKLLPAGVLGASAADDDGDALVDLAAQPSSSSSSAQPPPPPPLPTSSQKTIFLSLSPQSLASLSAALAPSSPNSAPSALLRSLAHFLPSIGIAHVSDTTFARHLALGETVREFASRRQRRQQQRPGTTAAAPVGPVLASACPGWVCYAEKAHGVLLPQLARARSPLGMQGAIVKGFWARKHGLRPDQCYHVAVQPCPDRKLESSRTGFRVLARGGGEGGGNGEGSTEAGDDDEGEDERVPETDLVLSTDEFAQLLERAGWDPAVGPPPLPDSDASSSSSPTTSSASFSSDAAPSAAAPAGSFTLASLPQDIRHPGSSSDGYLHAVLAHVAGAYEPEGGSSGRRQLVLAETPIRASADYVEYVLAVGPDPAAAPAMAGESSAAAAAAPAAAAASSGERSSSAGLELPPAGTVLLRAAACYGFKNLQNVVRKTKLAVGKASSTSAAAAGRAGGAGAGAAEKGAYDYVEVMACPSGCVNGGGQLKPPSLALPPSAPTTAAVDVDGPSPSSTTTIDAETRWSTKAHVALVEGVYQHAPPRSSSTATSSSALLPPPPPPKAIKARPLALSPLALDKQLDPAVRARADAMERVVRAEMDGFSRSNPDFYARSPATNTLLAGATANEEDDDDERAASAWRTTSFARVDPEESDGGLLGSGVVW